MNSRISIIALCTILLTGSLGIALPNAFAVSTPSLGAADPFGILASTYTNTVVGTSITGDLGYTTGPAVAPIVTGVTHIADATYTQAGLDQGTALAALNAAACDFNFVGATDLSGLVQPLTPGVYCSSGAMDIGGGGTVTLSGAGTYVFRPDGALTTSANSMVILSNGADACDVFWTPTAATTLGANSNFIGTDIDDSGITIGSTVTWTGRALAFGGTVTTDTDTITVPSCQTQPPIDGVVGGTIMPIDMTSLVLAGVMTNAVWIMPTLGGITIAAIALFKVKRKSI